MAEGWTAAGAPKLDQVVQAMARFMRASTPDGFDAPPLTEDDYPELAMAALNGMADAFSTTSGELMIRHQLYQNRIADIHRAGRRIADLKEEHRELVEALERCEHALAWASGLPEFQARGNAAAGWKRVAAPALYDTRALLSRIRPEPGQGREE